MIEFGCFTCPYTGQAETTVSELLERHDIYYVFKPLPLERHNNSYDTAVAVLCAEKQNKSWELRRRVFLQQEICSASGDLAIKELAKDAGLDMEEFSRCFDNNETGAELDRYIQQGKDSHVYATPTFFVNGEPLVGPKSLEEFAGLMK